jgi:hypothetical protein
MTVIAPREVSILVREGYFWPALSAMQRKQKRESGRLVLKKLEEEAREAAVHFEAVKLGLSQDKSGLVLKLSIHPNDMPKDVVTDQLGARYLVAIVRMDDNDQPVKPKEKDETDRLLSRAYALCRSARFASWASRRFGADPGSEEDAWNVESIARGILLREAGIQNRSAIRNNERAKQVFQSIFAEFDEAMRHETGRTNPTVPNISRFQDPSVINTDELRKQHASFEAHVQKGHKGDQTVRHRFAGEWSTDRES